MVSLSSLLVSFTALASYALAATKEYHWTADWTTANPDGVKERAVIGCNGEWPWPTLEADKGDRILIYLTNGLGDRNTSIHFHGLFQNCTNQMDGPEMVVQCPIAPNVTYVYNFTLEQAGSYWYHSHTSAQYPDGFRAPFIINDPEDFPYKDDYDEEVVLTISEWYHDMMDDLKKDFLNLYNPTGAEPIPQNLLFNDSRNVSWNIQPGTTYLVHLINIGAFVSQYFWIEDHNITVVEVDGVYTEKQETERLYVTVAQRYSFLLTTKNETDKNYNIVTHYDTTMLDVTYKDMVFTTSNWLVYDESAEKADPPVIDNDVDEPELEFLDDFYLVPYDKQELFPEADVTITLSVVMDNLDNGINYAFFNNLTYVAPKVPTIVTAMTAGKEATNAYIYGTNTNTFVLQHNEVIDIVLNNADTGTHPFHLHGHTFQVIERSEGREDDESPLIFNASDHEPYAEYPMRRDTVYVRPQGYFVLRFRADNPGAWFFHCHIEWHLEQGLAIVLVEAPLQLQEQETLTDNFLDACKAVGVPIAGNAAGITSDYMDLTGENIQAKTIPGKFTARGIVAMVFSCLSGILGIIAIAFYGMSEPTKELDRDVLDEYGIDYQDDDLAREGVIDNSTR